MKSSKNGKKSMFKCFKTTETQTTCSEQHLQVYTGIEIGGVRMKAPTLFLIFVNDNDQEVFSVEAVVHCYII